MRPVKIVAVSLAALGLVAGPSVAAPKPKITLHLCGDYTSPVRSQAGNSETRKFLSSNEPARLSSGGTYDTDADCNSGENATGQYSWTLDHSTSKVTGNGRQHGTEHGTWHVTLSDGTSVAGGFNGRISLDACDDATADGECFKSAGRINSNGAGGTAAGTPNTAHWNGSYATVVTASGCGDDDGCTLTSTTTLVYKNLGFGEDDDEGTEES